MSLPYSWLACNFCGRKLSLLYGYHEIFTVARDGPKDYGCDANETFTVVRKTVKFAKVICHESFVHATWYQHMA